jgi:hypothetical protein
MDTTTFEYVWVLLILGLSIIAILNRMRKWDKEDKEVMN